MRTAADATGRLLARDVTHRVRHRRLRRQRPARDRHGRRCGARSVSLVRGPGRRRSASTPTPRRPARTAPSGPPTSSGWARCRWTRSRDGRASTRSRSGGATCCDPGEQVRPGGKPLDADLVGDIEKVADGAWLGPRQARRTPAAALSVGLLAAGAHPVSSAVVRLEADGEAIVLVGSTEMGQGQRTAFAQIAAEVLGMPTRSASAASAPTPASRPTTAPRAPAAPRRSPGLAVQRAAQQVRADLLDIAALIWPGRATDIELARWRRLVRRRATDVPGAHRQALRAVRRPAHRRGRRPPRGHRLLRRGARLLGGLRRRRGGHASTATPAAVTVTRTATVADVGKAINPQLVERQDEGATMQGIGNALFEEMVFSDGLLLNDDLLEYRIPTHRGPARSTPPASSSRTATARARSGPRAAARERSRASSGPSRPPSPTPACPMHELPLTPERVWRTDPGNWRRYRR